MSRERILFVTGRLAEESLRRVLAPLSQTADFDYDVAVLGISVAALMHADWVSRKLNVSSRFDRAILPGWCRGDLSPLAERFHMPFQLGPKDLRDLPEMFGQAGRAPADLERYDIEILAEINDAPHTSERALVEMADAYRQGGADVIDLGCNPGELWEGVAGAVKRLVAEGHRVSIDSFDRFEVESAVASGAELVLSCNQSNIDWAAKLPAEVVAIPDQPQDLDSLRRTVSTLTEQGARYRIDPILEPIGFGFAESLARYAQIRREFPDAAMMMGIGNLTELTEVDTAGVNVLLAGFCQELRIGSVLTTQVINWARSAVKEFDIARRLVHHAVANRTLPKHVNAGLVVLRDAKAVERGSEELQQLAARLTDPNFRIFAEAGELHVMNRDGYWHGRDPYELFDRVTSASPVSDPAHAFYLGYELAKGATALTLGKRYTQDEALDWGFLTQPEQSAIERRGHTRHTGGDGQTGDAP